MLNVPATSSSVRLHNIWHIVSGLTDVRPLSRFQSDSGRPILCHIHVRSCPFTLYAQLNPYDQHTYCMSKCQQGVHTQRGGVNTGLFKTHHLPYITWMLVTVCIWCACHKGRTLCNFAERRVWTFFFSKNVFSVEEQCNLKIWAVSEWVTDSPSICFSREHDRSHKFNRLPWQIDVSKWQWQGLRSANK